MYASNEDEFNSQDGDWIFLKQTPPETTIADAAVNLVDYLQSTSSSSRSSNSSSSSSSSSKSDRSDSVSSIASIQHEHIENDDHVDVEEAQLLLEDPVLRSQNDDHIDDHNQDLLLSGELEDEALSSETMIEQNNEIETTPVINEYDLFNGGYDFSDESTQSLNNFERSTCAHAQQTEITGQLSLIGERQLVPNIVHYYRPSSRRKNAFIVYGFFILIFLLNLALIRVISSQRLMIYKLSEELEDTNQRLDEIKSVSIEDVEEKLAKQLEEKFEMLVNQKKPKHDQEKRALILQVNELYQIINFTRHSLTHTISQLSDENGRLQKQLTVLENRMQVNTKHSPMKEALHSDEDNCTKSTTSSSLDTLLSNFIKQTTSIAENTSINLSDFFQSLSTSLGVLVDHRHDFVEQSKQTLSDISRSPAAERVQMSLRQGMKHLSSSLRQAQTTYASWLGFRAEQREQARMDKGEQEDEQKISRNPWRWTFRRGQDREQMRHEIPTTKKHSTNKDYICHSGYDIPVAHCFQ